MKQTIILLAAMIMMNVFIAERMQGQATKSELSFSEEFMLNAFAIGKRSGSLQEIKQGWGHIMIDRSVTNDTLRIGNKWYRKGLGTHANSEIRVLLPSGAKRFTAEAGYDRNTMDLKFAKNKIVFSVELKGKVLWKSEPIAVTDNAVKVDVPLNGSNEFTLKVESETGDFSWTHANWADPVVELNTKAKLTISELASRTNVVMGLPISFVCLLYTSRCV